MKNSLFNKIIVACLVSALIFSTSCKKQETVKLPEPAQQSQQTQDKVGWFAVVIVAAVTIAIIEVTEGHYHEKTITHPDGTQSVEKWCEGNFGHCGMHARATGLPSNPTGFTPISSITENDEYDYTGSCQLVRTDEGKILLLVPDTPDLATFAKNFFYDKVIEITKPMVIDNPEVLRMLHRDYDDTITVKGKYEVYRAKEGSFIIIG